MHICSQALRAGLSSWRACLPPTATLLPALQSSLSAHPQAPLQKSWHLQGFRENRSQRQGLRRAHLPFPASPNFTLSLSRFGPGEAG